MKITLIHYTFGGTVGGVEFVMEQHARLFARAGHEVSVICQRGTSDSARVHVLRDANAVNLGALLRDSDLTMVHNVMTMPFDIPLTGTLRDLAAAGIGGRFIAWVHDLAACNPDYEVGENRALLATAHPNFAYVAVSEHRRAEFCELSGHNALVVPNGIDPEVFLGLTENVAGLLRRHRILEREIVLFSPARLVKRKNLELSIRTLGALRKRGVDACLILTVPPDPHRALGAAPTLDSLRALARELGVEAHVIFPDFAVSERDLVSLYAAVDALFFPSRAEGFGIPLLEAALLRLPIFCSDIPPHRAIAPEHAQFFSPDAEPAEIAGTIRKLAACDSAGTARKRVVREFAWDAIYTRHLAPLLTTPSSIL